jgi:hypothetical protein
MCFLHYPKMGIPSVLNGIAPRNGRAYPLMGSHTTPTVFLNQALCETGVTRAT